MNKTLAIYMVQDDFPVGDINGNVQRILHHAKLAQAAGARLVVYPELTLVGYPPEDLLLRPSLKLRIAEAIAELCAAQLPIALIVGVPAQGAVGLENQAWVIDQGEVVYRYAKRHLPNYQVFDELRYFVPGTELGLWQCEGVCIGLSICEDIWFDEVPQQLVAAGAQCIITLNASPYYVGRAAERRARVLAVAAAHHVPVIYVNAAHAQDELVFDGGSVAVNAGGSLHKTLPEFEPAAALLQLDVASGAFLGEPLVLPCLADEAAVYAALKLGLRSYVDRNGFPSVVLGLSGGIDSALSLAIAVDALGPDRVHAVMMPYRYTSSMSLEDAKAQAEMLGVDYQVLPIENLYDAGMQTLSMPFANTTVDLTEQNLQSRLRGLLLMALSNKFGHMVLTTGNKSELAVGYATLYGDMCGGFNALKDVPKMMVFALARYRNSLSRAIPERVITRPPSAELAPDQKDEDSLPPYPILDAIIQRYVEWDESAETIVAAGFSADAVYSVVRLIDRNEYKRRQAPEGVRISPRGFGRDRRYPLTHRWLPGV